MHIDDWITVIYIGGPEGACPPPLRIRASCIYTVTVCLIHFITILRMHYIVAIYDYVHCILH